MSQFEEKIQDGIKRYREQHADIDLRITDCEQNSGPLTSELESLRREVELRLERFVTIARGHVEAYTRLVLNTDAENRASISPPHGANDPELIAVDQWATLSKSPSLDRFSFQFDVRAPKTASDPEAREQESVSPEQVEEAAGVKARSTLPPGADLQKATIEDLRSSGILEHLRDLEQKRLESLVQDGLVPLSHLEEAKDLALAEHDDVPAGRLILLSNKHATSLPVISKLVDVGKEYGGLKELLECSRILSSRPGEIEFDRWDKIPLPIQIKLTDIMSELVQIRREFEEQVTLRQLALLYRYFGNASAARTVVEQTVAIAEDKEMHVHSILKLVLSAVHNQGGGWKNTVALERALTEADYDSLRELAGQQRREFVQAEEP